MYMYKDSEIPDLETFIWVQVPVSVEPIQFNASAKDLQAQKIFPTSII